MCLFFFIKINIGTIFDREKKVNNMKKIFLFEMFFPKASVELFSSVLMLTKKSVINHSALFCCAQRRNITCGTHFEETKLVASITGRPVPESMSISWIFTPVGTISWGTMELKQLFLDLIPLKMGGTTCRYLVHFFPSLHYPSVTLTFTCCLHAESCTC